MAHRLYAMGNGTRFYDPDLGQFTQKDPLYGDESEPRSLSPYAYSFNNPVWYMDPTGLAAQDPQGDHPDFKKSVTVPNTIFAEYKDAKMGVRSSVLIGPDDSKPEPKPKRIKWGADPFRSQTKKAPQVITLDTTPYEHPSTTPSTATPSLEGTATEPVTETETPQPEPPKETTTTQPAQKPELDLGGYEPLHAELETPVGRLNKYFDQQRNSTNLPLWQRIGYGIGGAFTRPAAEAQDFTNGVLNIPYDVTVFGKQFYFSLYDDNANDVADRSLAAAAGLGRAALSTIGVVGAWEGLAERRLAAAAEEAAEAGTQPTRAWGPCFVAGTPVAVLGGLQAIETLKAGDWAASFNEQTRQVEYKPITAIYQHLSKEVLNLTIEGEAAPIRTTPQHPFYVYHARSNLFGEKNDEDDCGWMEAGDLRPGDLVRNAAGAWVKVLAVGEREPGEWVYNFTVDQNHTYFVGSQGILVHNQNPVNQCAEELPPVKFQNLFPEDTPKPINRTRLVQAEDGRWHEVLPDGRLRTATGLYDFVRIGDDIFVVRNGKTFGRERLGHVDLAQGGLIDYGGQAQFSHRYNRGHLRWWSNGTGHYRPVPDFAHQAGLPLEKFQPEIFETEPQQIGFRSFPVQK